MTELLRFDEAKAGDVFFVPAGTIHSIGKEILLAEIQQTSDVTYRIFDYHRKDANGNYRELHTDLALDAIDFSENNEPIVNYSAEKNSSSEILSCNYFTTNILEFDRMIEKDYFELDSFVIYITISGNFKVETEQEKVTVKQGETILLPANTNMINLVPESKEVKLLEVFIK